jgi:ADP-ribose pyrophosphatase YjhB (NUDIX family)
MQTYCTTCGHATTKQADNLGVCDQGHENWINPNPGATVFIVKDGKVLYGVRNMEPYKGQLNLPGGFLELNESAEQAAMREIKEELGVDIEILDILGTYPDDYQGRPTLNIMFIARHVAGEFTPSDDLNGGELTWRSIDDLPTPSEFGWKWYVPAQRDLVAWWQKQPQ